MRAIVHLTREALVHPPSIAALVAMAAEHQLVLVCAQCAADVRLVRALRHALPDQHVVAVVVEGEVPVQERLLIRQILDEGALPLILTAADPAAAQLANWMWLDADGTVALPA
jgi:hypothetical protein